MEDKNIKVDLKDHPELIKMLTANIGTDRITANLEMKNARLYADIAEKNDLHQINIRGLYKVDLILRFIQVLVLSIIVAVLITT